jgi:uncharacterized membrane protein YbhN (UPF0104 family)
VLTWVGLIVSAAFAYLAVRGVRFGSVWDALRSSDYVWLVPALAALALFIWTRVVRWLVLFEPETRPPLRDAFDALVVGYLFNNILPARAGEAARILVIGREAGTSKAEAAATIVVERTYDVLTLLVMLFALLPWLPSVSWVRTAAELAVALSIALIVMIVVLTVFGERPIRFLLRPATRLPLIDEERVAGVAAGLVRGFVGFRRIGPALSALVWTVAGWLVLGLCFWLVMVGFHLHLSFVAALLALIATGVGAVVPSSPAGVGVFEAAVVVSLSAYGVSNSQALSYAVVLHALNVIPLVIAGAVVLHRHALRGVAREAASELP